MRISFGALASIFDKKERKVTRAPITVQVPPLDSYNALTFSSSLKKLPKAEHFHFDFKNLVHIEPFGMLVTAQAFREFIANNNGAQCEAINLENCNYAAHMGFFQASGIPFGKFPGQAKGSSKYIPMTFLPVEKLKKEANEKNALLGDIVEQHAKMQAAMLLQQDSSELYNVLGFCIREILRNVIEHSQSDTLGVCGQYWPSKSIAEVGIIDSGVGIKDTLKRNGRLQINDDRDALKNAILPGITGNVHQLDPDAPWANSGYGLFMTSKICQEGGDFLISSGSAALRLSEKGKTYHPSNTMGTAVRMVINTSQCSNAEALLSKFRKQGSEIARKLKKTPYVDAISASTMLDLYLANKKR